MIWQRYFLKQHLSAFFLFIFCFYGLYVLIDYATHAHYFHQSSTDLQWKAVFSYYLFDFVKILEVLIPFSLLIATIKTVTSLSVHNELVALLTNGIKLKKLLRPFLFVGLFFTLFLALNTQIFLPEALKELKAFNHQKAVAKVKKLGTKPILNISLEDGTTLIFQDYDAIEERFFDAYWIKSIDNIYRIKFLYPKEKKPKGTFVTHFTRSSTGALESKASYSEKIFSDMHFNKQTLFEWVTTAEEQSYASLLNKIPSLNEIKSEKQAQLVTSFYYKLAMPWLALLAVIGPIPFCVRFTRNLSLFMIYAWSIFALVAFNIIMHSAQVLGERQVLFPAFAIGIPFFLILSIFSLRYLKLR